MNQTTNGSALSHRLLGRLGACLFVLGGVVSVLVLVGPQPGQVDTAASLAVGFGAIAVGIAAWVMPWDQHPKMLWSLAPIALLVVALGNQYGGLVPFTYGIYFALAFAWIGLALGRYASLIFAPLGAAAYVVPLALHDQGGAAIGTVSTVIPVCAAIGESVAWVAGRLREAEREVADREGVIREAYDREREASGRIQQLDRMKDLFLQRISHEFRTPLTSVLGYTATLQHAGDKLDPATKTEVVTRLEANARRLERLLSDLLDLDKLARGAIELRRSNVDMSNLVRSVVAGLDWGGRIVRVSVPYVVASVDNAIVERLVEHLLLGSIRHAMPDSEILFKLEPCEGGIVFSSEQHETVIPESVKGEMFKPFGDDGSIAAHDPGPGTDLALVARFAELHGGRAWTEDLTEGGSALRVYLPA